MRRSLCALLAVPVALATASPALAQDKDAFNSTGLRKAVTLDGVREHQAALQFIADANDGTRVSGTPGTTRPSTTSSARLEDAGYDVTLPGVRRSTTSRSSRRRRSTGSRRSPSAYPTPEDFATMTYSGCGDVTAEAVARHGRRRLARPGLLGEPTSPASAAGNIALDPARRLPVQDQGDQRPGRGAVGVVIYNNAAGPLNGTLGSVGQNIPVVGTTPAIGQALVALGAAGPSISVDVDAVRDRADRECAGRHAAAATRTARSWSARTWTPSSQGPGINDNGSGTAGILEIAEQFAAARHRAAQPGPLRVVGRRGVQPHRLDVLREQPHRRRARASILANLNFDMIGSPNYVRFVYDGDNSAFPRRPAGGRGPGRLGPDRVRLRDVLRQPGPRRPSRRRSPAGRTTARSSRRTSRPAGSSRAPRASRPRSRPRSTAAPRAWPLTRATTRPATRSRTTPTRASTRCPTRRPTRSTRSRAPRRS